MAEVVRIVLVDRGEWTADGLCARTGAPYPTMTKEIRRLQRAGLVTTRTVGRTKFVSADAGDPAVRALTRTVSLLAPEGGEDVAKKKGKKKDGKKKKNGKKK